MFHYTGSHVRHLNILYGVARYVSGGVVVTKTKYKDAEEFSEDDQADEEPKKKDQRTPPKKKKKKKKQTKHVEEDDNEQSKPKLSRYI